MDDNSNVKKLAVIPFDVFNMMQQQNKPNQLLTPPEMKHLSNLDNELKSVLFNNYLPPDLKFRKYVELLNQYNTTMDQIKKPFEIQIREKVHSSNQIGAIPSAPQSDQQQQEQQE